MRKFLRSILVDESKAYGFTIAFWGSGTLLVGMLGMPGIYKVLSFGLGAVIGFGIMAVFAFKGALEDVGQEETPELIVFSTIHYLSALAPILISYFIGLKTDGWTAFMLAGANISILYNLLMLLEKLVSDEALMLERKLEEKLSF